MGRIFRFIRALFRYAVYGHFKDVGFKRYVNRLEKCAVCDKLRDNWTCGVCGCYLTKKAKWVTECCPENRWPDNDD